MKTRSSALIGLLLTIVLFVAINVIGGTACRGKQFDLTEEKLYTLSDGAIDIVDKLEEPIRLRLFYSEDLAAQIPMISDYGRRVTEILEQFQRAAPENVIIERVNPEPYSEAEEEAAREGIVGVPVSNGEQLYFGLVGTNSTDTKKVIAFFDPSRERFLEYELSKLTYQLANPVERKIGVMSSIAWGGQPNPMNPMQQPAPDWALIGQLRDYFEVERVETTATEIDPELDVLVLLHAKDLSDATLYAIDQYALSGGKLFIAVDSYCEIDASQNRDPRNPMAGGANAYSKLDKLFGAWGLEQVNGKVAADRKLAYRNRDRSGKEIDILHYLRLDEENVNEGDPVTSQLDAMIMAASGVLRPVAGATTTFEPLLETTSDSMQLESSELQFLMDPTDLLDKFVPGFEELTMAARVTGQVSSAFPDGKPVAPEAAPESEPAEGEHVAQGNITAVVVADVDFLFDQFWIQQLNFGGMSLGSQKLSDNGDFAINSVDNLSGGEDLLSLRARGKFSRPFTRVEELRREAEQEYRDEQSALDRELEEAQNRINELQREKSPDQQYILSPEQEDELNKAREAQVAAKRKQRDLQHALLKEIESLGTRLKLMNIFAIPAIVTVLALGLFFVRRSRRRRAA